MKIKRVVFFRTLLAIFVVSYFGSSAIAQRALIPVTGTVTEVGGEIMPGVSIVLKGSNLFTMSGTDGKYFISVPPEDAVLVFTFNGYQTVEIPVNDKRVIDVEMNIKFLIAIDSKVYLNDYYNRLSKSAVRKLMADNTVALQLYNKGMSSNTAWNILGISGLSMFAVGSTMAVISDDNGLYSVGLAVTFIGAVLKIRSIKLVKKSVNMYNYGIPNVNKTTGMELKFGITGNGVGVALSF
ncbi:MAG: carboxypeptidase-like regulatory domain-containing protein [Clostridiales bacterium]|jgi:hypothetical protein|nr:carboxypeptidase-like regulatory domain-containing protein [Clostridiales bacterium]